MHIFSFYFIIILFFNILSLRVENSFAEISLLFFAGVICPTVKGKTQ